MRTPQQPESLDASELAAIAKQLEDALRICREAESLMKAKEMSGLYVIYKASFAKAMDSLRRVQESIYRSTTAAMQGRPLGPSSVSPRSVIRKTVAIEQQKTKSIRDSKRQDRPPT
jgi:hypothetical protein